MSHNVKRELNARDYGNENLEFEDQNNLQMSFSEDEDGSDDSSMSFSFDDDGVKPRNKRKKRSSTERPQNNERQVRRKYRKHLIANCTKLRENDIMTDCEIKVMDMPGIRVHRLILAAASPYFRSLLQSGMQEAISGEIIMKDVSYETVKLLVAYSYGQDFTITSQNAQEILEAADCYQFDLLKNHCERYLSAEIDTHNCFGLLQLADFRQLEYLKEKTLTFALKNFEHVVQSDEFVSLPLNVITKYLSDERLVAKREELVYNAAVRWIQHTEKRREESSEILKCVRLGLLAARFLLDEVENEKNFKDEKSKLLIDTAKKFKMLPFEEQKQENFPSGQPRLCSGITEILVVVGGICMNKRLKEVDFYHKEKGWNSLEDISTEHSNMHSYSVVAHDNDIYITGGHSGSQCTVDIVSVYQSKYNKWIRLNNMKHPRERHGSACVDGAIYVVGGLMAGKQKRKPAVLQAVERFNPKFQKWEEVKPLPKRCYSPGVANYKNKLYVIGGVSMTDETAQSSSKMVLPLVQVYCPLADEWKTFNICRALARLSCALYRDYVYIISNNSSVISRYCPNTHSLTDWCQLDSLGEKLEFAGLAAYQGKLYISGGQQEDQTLKNVIVIDIETKEIFTSKEENLRRALCMHGCVIIDHYESDNNPSTSGATQRGAAPTIDTAYHVIA